MDLKNLPFLRLNFFYFQFARDTRGLFIVGMAMLLLVFGFFAYTYTDITAWSLEMIETQQSSGEDVRLVDAHENYRDIGVDITAYQQSADYVAGPLLPHHVPIALFAIFQVLAWAIFLGATSLIRSRWSYLFYLIFILNLYFSGGASLLFPDSEEAVLINFAFLIPFLGLAYAFQVNMLKWSLPLRVLVFGLLLGAIYGGVYVQRDFIGLYEMGVNGLFFLSLISAIYLLFIGKEPLNILMYAATNRVKMENRLKLPIIITLYVLMLFWEFLLLQDVLHFRWIPIDAIGNPGHVLGACIVLTVFTAQNQFHHFRNVVSSIEAYTFLMIGLGTITLSSAFLFASTGDFVYSLFFQRLGIIFIFIQGFFQFIFILINHYELLQKRINLYYLMMQTIRFPYMAVILMTLFCSVFLEGGGAFKSPRFVLHSYTLGMGDVYWLQGKNEAARKAYEMSARSSPISAKAHYNLGVLQLSKPKLANLGLASLGRASDRFHLPAASLNQAQVLAENQRWDEAAQTLKKALKREANPYLANNLGRVYEQQNQADSAITWYKQALLADGSLSSIYSNLGNLYMKYDRPEEGTQFLQAALSTSKPSNTAINNGIYHKLAQHSKELEIPQPDLSDSTDFETQYNYSLHLIREQEFDQATAIAQKWLDQAASPMNAVLLNIYLEFKQDSIENAVNRAIYLAETFERHAHKFYYLLGASYFEKDVPEMAWKYFYQAGEAGLSEGYLRAAQMELDMGRFDSAQWHLSEARIKDEKLWDDVAKELAMLDEAKGNYVFARTEWDFEGITEDEMMRVAMYADSSQQFVMAIDYFRKVLALDSTNVKPYLELGNLFAKYGEWSRAEETYQYGLEIEAQHPDLLVAMANLRLAQDKIDEAEKLIQPLLTQADTLMEAQLVQAKVWLSQDQASEAIDLLKKLHAQDPLQAEVIQVLATAYLLTDQSDKGYELIYDALKVNDQNAEIWYYYAVFMRVWNPKDAGFGAAKAMELSQFQERKEQIAEEFAKELSLLSEKEDVSLP